jgi:hypothetical protein
VLLDNFAAFQISGDALAGIPLDDGLHLRTSIEIDCGFRVDRDAGNRVSAGQAAIASSFRIIQGTEAHRSRTFETWSKCLQ